jgi:hypothetical protein
MKVTVNVEATAQEMREFLGLPNVQPLQDEMLQMIRDNMNKGVAGFDPLTLMKPLFPAQIQSMEMLQKAFWDAFTQAGGQQGQEAPEKKPEKKPEKRSEQ